MRSASGASREFEKQPPAAGNHVRPRGLAPAFGLALAIALCAVSAAAADGPPTRYRLRASLSLSAPQIDGTLEVTFTNSGARTIDHAVFFAFPNRFASPDQGINDFNRPFVYPEQDFDPGALRVLAARDGGVPASPETIRRASVPDGCLVSVPIAPLAPGATRTLTLRFQTRVPYRFGAFGEFGGELTAVGGAYPYLAALRADGTWDVDGPPPAADFAVELTVPAGLELLLNGRHFSAQPFVNLQVRGVHYLAFVLAPHFLRSESVVGGTRVVLYRRPDRLTSRVSPEPAPAALVLDALRDIVAHPPPSMPPPPRRLVVVEAPLRLNLAAPGEGMVVVSDRTLKVLWLLRPFHEQQLAQAAYEEWLRPTVTAREPSADYPWVSEGLAHVAAQRFLAEARPGTRSVQDWIELFNIFAIVDRFETAPKIPFVAAFFERARHADPLHEQITTFNNDLPPGHVILGKLRQLVGDDRFAELVDRCLVSPLPFRGCAGAAAGEDLHWFFRQWLQPYPQVNYDFAAVDLNERHDGRFTSAVTVRRIASRPLREPVEVELRSLGGRPVVLRWDGAGDRGQLRAVTGRRIYQAVIDPRRQLIETTRADDASPPTPQVVLDSAEVEITSTEFGFSGLVVGRGRYDYRKDLAAAAFYTNRSIGVDVGPRYHWGRENDPTSYRNNLYAFYGLQALDASFTDARRPTVRTHGHTNGLGVRYDYNNLYSYDNPTHEIDFRLYADWYDRGLDSDFNYVDWGGSVVLTHPLWTYRTIVAGELSNGFTEPLGSSRVPNQGLYSLGGSRSIRGIGAEDELGRNLAVIRAEVRQDVYPELDLNLLDLLVLRRTQVRVFVDSGEVGTAIGPLYDPRHYAVGVGTGLGAVYDFMGFFPALAYFEVATRVDRAGKAGEVQFLFGSRQSF